MLFLTFNIYLFYLKLKTNLKLQIYEKKNIYIPLFFFHYCPIKKIKKREGDN